ncbi:TetR/AcrR family transcriptional regulator [Actinoplanes couchii]|uniref:TetR family transcriptional regulator n=1 Tax=Actinoplanes couchii TaxID=403638 RepID=A0ABQ3XT51_9ACTN|nr:TetR/AcrR family transcriptional regulator [Actinoplanes couchii]MDR6318531.1 AcrR family transcriptional regulator [Actinoplanes couchii]GID61537.1 TetR family transcriptional regulator [Actinoplanes couchii]
MSRGSYHSPLREGAAASTRAAILQHARRLFLERGYAHVTVPEIARAAGVAPQTVHASTGGKSGILSALLRPIIDDTTAREANATGSDTTDPVQVISLAAAGTRRVHEQYRDLLNDLVRKAPGEPAAQQVVDTVTAKCLGGLTGTADRLAALGALRPDITRDDAVDILWFYFGNNAWYGLVADRGWTFTHAQEWLFAGACTALLDDPASSPADRSRPDS